MPAPSETRPVPSVSRRVADSPCARRPRTWRAMMLCVVVMAAVGGCANDSESATAPVLPRGLDTQRATAMPMPTPAVDPAENTAPGPEPTGPLTPAERIRHAFVHGHPPDAILVGGEPIHVGTRVVLFTEERGYNAYVGPSRFGTRTDRFHNGQPDLPPPLAMRHATQGFSVGELQAVIDRFVIHYDACGSSKRCFDVLRERGLSVHFMLDVDGTIYQTLDVQERAWHAGDSNTRSIGIEIANVGAYPPGRPNPFARWYSQETAGQTRLLLPPDANLYRPSAVLSPARPEPVVGTIHGHAYEQYDLTDAQYDALAKLTAALCRTFPQIRPDAPRGVDGEVTTTRLSDAQLRSFEGLVGHYHLTTQKQDPGPAFDWERLIRGTRRELAK